MKIVIAGGGIGGLTAALCLNHFGFEAQVLEQAPVFSEIGAGIQISPNGMKVLQALGLDDAIAAVAFRPTASTMRIGTSGDTIFERPMGSRMERKYGAPYLHIHRADLIEILAQAVRERMPDALRTNVCVTGYLQDDNGVYVQTNGDAVAGDILIGADGIKSAIRNTMLGPQNPRFTGNVAWRAVVPVEKLGRHVPEPKATVWTGKDKHAVTYLLRGGELANFVGVVERDDWREESWSATGTREQALADFAGWHPVVTTLIEQADAHYRWALFDRKPLGQWTDGRAALLGDAAQPMLPFMAQGAAQAIEDAYVLARALSENSDTVSALNKYANKRKLRTARVQAAASANMELFHQGAGPQRKRTFGPIWAADKLAPDLIDAKLDWIYGHDVTA